MPTTTFLNNTLVVTLNSVDLSDQVTAVTINTFTVTTGVLTTSGNVTVYNQILTELDCSTGTAFYTPIPGEGILALDGIYVGLPAADAVSSTIFYG